MDASRSLEFTWRFDVHILVGMTTPSTRPEIVLNFEELTDDPFPTYHRLRRDTPWAWSPQLRSWVVTRYEDVARVDREAETFSSVIDDDPATRVRGRAMTRTDGREHLRLRAAAGGPLRRRTVASRWAEVVAEHVARHIDRVADRHEFDVLADFATPLVADVLLDLLGIHGPTAADVSRWSAAFVAGVAEHGDDPAVWAAVRAARGEVQEHVLTAVGRALAAPDNGVVSAMVEASAGEPDVEEIGSNVRLLLSGGYNEPRDMVATLVWLLLAHPAERSVALASPEALEAAIDEAVRWLTPLGAAPRQTTRDVEVTGVRIRRGERVLALLAAGNHDPERFADPETYRPDRSNLADHMGFGRGAHFCLGAHLARQVMRAAVPQLLAIPGLALGGEIRFRGWRFRTPLAVPVRRAADGDPAEAVTTTVSPQRPATGSARRPDDEAQRRPAPQSSSGNRMVLCALADVPEGKLLRVEPDGGPALAVAVVDGEVFCIEDQCSHENATLSEGWLDGACVECPLHGSRFDLRDGRPDAPPAWLPVRTHAVTAIDGLVHLTGNGT